MKFKQFAALSYRMRDDDVEILLITTRKKHRWSVPKGWPIKHSTPQTIAKIEAYEEAGVRGDIGSKQIGRFTKRRRRKLQSVLCEVEIFPLEVTRQQGDWPEQRERRRMWVAAPKAAKLVKNIGIATSDKELKRALVIPGSLAVETCTPIPRSSLRPVIWMGVLGRAS